MEKLTNIENTIISALITAHEMSYVNLDTLMNTGITKLWFTSKVNQTIFDVVSIYYNANNKKYNENVLIQYLEKNGVENVADIILDLMSIGQTSMSILLEYIAILKDNYKITMVKQIVEKSSTLLNEKDPNIDAITQIIQNSLNDFSFLSNNGYTRSLADVRKDRKSKPPVQRLRTGIPFIDTVLTDNNGNIGLRNEGLMFISGLKQSGKTFTLMRIIENISKNHPVLFGSLEFGEELYDEFVEEAEEQGFFNGNIENIYTFDKVYDIDGIIAEIRFQHKVNNIKLAAIDSMMRISNANPLLKTDERRISETFSKLGMLTKELQIPIIIIVQSSKEDLKSSIISVKGSMNADHEAYVWYHIYKTDPKNTEDERRTVVWNKNKDTHKHPKQYLMFVPQTKDFYQYESDENGKPSRPLHDYRKPKNDYAIPDYSKQSSKNTPKVSVFNDDEIDNYEMPDFDI